MKGVILIITVLLLNMLGCTKEEGPPCGCKVQSGDRQHVYYYASDGYDIIATCNDNSSSRSLIYSC